MNYVYHHDLERFAPFVVCIWNVDPEFKDLEWTAQQEIKKTKEFFKSIGMPAKFEELEITAKRLEEMAQKATQNGPISNCVNLDTEGRCLKYL